MLRRSQKPIRVDDDEAHICLCLRKSSGNIAVERLLSARDKEQLELREVLSQLDGIPSAVATIPNCNQCVFHHPGPGAKSSKFVV